MQFYQGCRRPIRGNGGPATHRILEKQRDQGVQEPDKDVDWRQGEWKQCKCDYSETWKDWLQKKEECLPWEMERQLPCKQYRKLPRERGGYRKEVAEKELVQKEKLWKEKCPRIKEA